MRRDQHRGELLGVRHRVRYEHGNPDVQWRDMQLRLQFESSGLQRRDRAGHRRL
jgi:hypothetical protein